MSVYQDILSSAKEGRKLLAVLLDPDHLHDEKQLRETVGIVHASGADLILYGGSLMTGAYFEQGLKIIRQCTHIPVILFPGSAMQVSPLADAILFTSLISGRNPEFLIGQQVLAAPLVKAAGLEVIPTGYMIVDSGRPTTASYVSNTAPIPHNKPEIAATTAMAGEMLGQRLIYLDGGSGAEHAVTAAMIAAVKAQVSVPLVVGGGISTPEELLARYEAGADMAVVGTAAEKDPFIIRDMVCALKAAF
ncbi:MAG: geranylgeranylglyceryl/heptaprenylglyceryl phosphate synthase [Cryomorphaceae bacterium]|nr:MAG: geranylgeranylglyceryl/heptaprenylglyceryl phosphate synthase [Cryomorphaceae bacterium]